MVSRNSHRLLHNNNNNSNVMFIHTHTIRLLTASHIRLIPCINSLRSKRTLHSKQQRNIVIAVKHRTRLRCTDNSRMADKTS